MDIEISPRSIVDMYMRQIYNQYTRAPCGTSEYWDKKLKEFDPNLSLRISNKTGRFVIFYEIHGVMSSIHSFGRHESFGKAFREVKERSLLNSRKLNQMRIDADKAEEDRQTYDIDQCAEEFGIELRHGAVGRVVNDTVDAFAPEKPSIGGEMI